MGMVGWRGLFLLSLLVPISNGCVRGGFDTDHESPWPPLCHGADGCVECEPIAHPSCGAGAGPGDGDDLSDTIDPWPATCNAPAFSEPFLDAALPRWETYHRGTTEYVRGGTCGTLLFQVPANFTVWAWAAAGTFPPPGLKSGYLVQVRFLAPPGPWKVAVAAEASGIDPYLGLLSVSRECRVDTSDGASWRLASTVKTPGGSSENAAYPSPGTGVVLVQSWVSQNQHHCLFQAGGEVLATVSTPLTGSLDSNGTIVLYAENARASGPSIDVEVDSVRVFQPE